MIIQKLNWLPLLLALLLQTVSCQTQNEETYDNNDWIPITPSPIEAEAKKAQGRVLNLDAPNQKFFPDYTRKHHSQPPASSAEQFLRETSLVKNSRPQKTYQQEPPYKFESVPVKQFVQQPSQYQQFIPPPPPPRQPQLNQDLVAPPLANTNYYESNGGQQEYQLPFNRSYYQSLNPGTINQEILAANIQKQLGSTTLRPVQEKETVQLLYVPLENLKSNQQLPARQQSLQEQPKINIENSAFQKNEKELPGFLQQQPKISIDNIVYQRDEKQHSIRQQTPKITLDNIENDFINQALAAHKLQEQFQLNQQPLVISTTTTTTTPKPIKKRKPHQPPLAVFMEKVGAADVKDVLEVLKNAKSIAVQDSIGPDSPNVFVGPSNLNTEGYAKFPLPYLSTVEGNRIERKVEDLPFFVAPLSYKTPDGYSKIPLPSPHVGSVVVSTKEPHEKLPVARPTQIVPNQISFDSKGNAFLTNPSTLLGLNNDYYQEKDYLDTFQPNPKPQPQPDYLSSFQFDPQFYQTTQPQIQSVTPKDPENVFRFTEQPPKVQQITTEAVPVRKLPSYTEPQPENIQNYQQQNYQPVRQNPLQQYELHQINEFIQDGRSSTPAVPVQNYQFSTTQRTTPRIRQRGRKPTVSTTTTLKPIVNEQTEKYTVLEEFSIKPKPTTVKYTTTVETIPAKVYKLSSDQVFVQQQTEQPDLKQHVLNQDMLDDQVLNSRVPLRTTPQPQNVYQPTTTLIYDNAPPENYREQQVYQQPARQQPEVPQLYKLSEVQRPLQQQELTQIYKSEQQKPKQVYQSVVSAQQEQYQQPLVFNRGQPAEEQQQQQEEDVEKKVELNPFLPSLINNLQDQAVRPLLVPNLLVPTTEKQTTTVYTSTTTEEIRTEAPKIDTTTRKSRGRQRGHTSLSRYSTTTSAPRTRNVVNRRRPTAVRTTTARVADEEETTTRKPVNSQRLRFRTRGRTVPSTPATERVLVESFRQPNLEGGFQASSGDPQSYMQFEHTIDNQEVITVKPGQSEEKSREYHQVYNIPVQAQLSHEENSASSNPVVDIQITHPTTTPRAVEVTTKAPRGRGRARIRTRPAATRATTTTTETSVKEASEEEFYGFIRSPNFNRPEPVYVASTPKQVEEQVTFIGEIRPKYGPTTETVAVNTETAPRFRTRSRIRPGTRQQSNEIKEEQATRRNNAARTRSRGSAHYQVPDGLNKKANDEDDVAGGNYPASYLRARSTGLTTEKPGGFQITVDPDSSAEDQEPQLSQYRPKILPPEWVDASILPPLNELPMEDKAMQVQFNSAEEGTTKEQHVEVGTEAVITETEEAPTTTLVDQDYETTTTTTTTVRQPGRRRGVWKLVKHRPVDQFETAESQNYQSVLNSFDGILKEKSTTSAPVTEGSLFDTLYNMFGMNDKSEEEKFINETTTIPTNEENLTTTTLSPTFPEEYTTIGENAESTTTEVPDVETTEQQFEVEPWDMRQVKTSTSTEISHETEICYKGRCIKSKDKKKL